MKNYAILLSFLLPFASVAERAMPIQDGKLTTPLNANQQSITNASTIKFMNGTEFDGTPASVGGVGTNDFRVATNDLWTATADNSNRTDSAFAQIETNRQHIALTSNAVVVIQGRTNEWERLVKDGITNNHEGAVTILGNMTYSNATVRGTVDMGTNKLVAGVIKFANGVELSWNNNEEAQTLTFTHPDGGSIDINGESYRMWKNIDDVPIKNGQPVVLSSGQGKVGTIKLADADDTTRNMPIGQYTGETDLPVGSVGRVTVFGAVKNAHFASFSDTALAEGYKLYLSANRGYVTTNPPVAPIEAIMLGVLTYAQVQAGHYDLEVSIQCMKPWSKLDERFASNTRVDTISNSVVAVSNAVVAIQGRTNTYETAYAQSQTNKTHIASLSNSVVVIQAKTSNWNTAYSHTSRSDNPHSVTASQVSAIPETDRPQFYTVDQTVAQSISNNPLDVTGKYTVLTVDTVGTVTATKVSPSPIYEFYGGYNSGSTTYTSGTAPFMNQTLVVTVTPCGSFNGVNWYAETTYPEVTVTLSDYSSTPFYLYLSWNHYGDSGNWPYRSCLVDVYDPNTGIHMYSYRPYYDAPMQQMYIDELNFPYFTTEVPFMIVGSAPVYTPVGALLFQNDWYVYARNNEGLLSVYSANYSWASTVQPPWLTIGYRADLSWDAVAGADSYIVQNITTGYYIETPYNYVTDDGYYMGWTYGSPTITPSSPYYETTNLMNLHNDVASVVANEKGQIVVTVSDPNTYPPMVNNSVVKVDNLNADLLDGLSSSAFQPAGSYQPAGNYTTPTTVTQIVAGVVSTNVSIASRSLVNTTSNNTLSASIQNNGDVRVSGVAFSSIFPKGASTNTIVTSGIGVPYATIAYTDGTNVLFSSMSVNPNATNIWWSTNNCVTIQNTSISDGVVYSAVKFKGYYYVSINTSGTISDGVYRASSLDGVWTVVKTRGMAQSAYNINNLQASGDVLMYRSGDTTTVMYSGDGVSWTTITGASTGNTYSMHNVKQGDIWMLGGLGGAVRTSSNDGATWGYPAWSASLGFSDTIISIRSNSRYAFFSSATRFVKMDLSTFAVTVLPFTPQPTYTSDIAGYYIDDTIFMYSIPSTNTMYSLDGASTFTTLPYSERVVAYGDFVRTVDGKSIFGAGGWNFTGATNKYLLTIPLSNTVDYTVSKTMNPPRWQDTIVSGIALRSGGSSPTRVAVGSSSVIYGTAFGINDDSDYAGQVQHGVASTNANFTAFYYNPHIHVSCNRWVANETNATFVLNWEIAPVGSNYLGSSIARTSTVSFASGETNVHKLVSFGFITNNVLQGADSLAFRGNIKRIATPTIGNDVSDTPSKAVLVDSLDYHFPFDSIGSSAIFGDAP